MKERTLFWVFLVISGLSLGCVDTDCETGNCADNYGVSPEYSVTRHALTAKCSITVNGKGSKNMETDYVPNVTWCENGGSNTEGLKAQAVAARSVAYYKGNSINDGQDDQVYSCTSRAPNATQFANMQAVTNATAGIILRYHDTNVCAFYVSGTTVPNLDSECKTTSTSWPQSNVTYNWGKSGDGIKQSSIGWVNKGNYANRGCMAQNGATCLGAKGWVWENIVKFFYGMDIQIVQATGDCVKHPNCTTQVANGTVIDDTDECFSRTPGEKWFTLSSGNGGTSQFAYTLSGNATSTGTWNLNVKTAGTYEVLAYIDGAHGARSTKAPYRVRAKGQEKAVTVDISKSGWISIGKFEFAAGRDQWVKLTDASGEAYTNTSGKRVVFDALKFVSAATCKDACSKNGTVECSGNGYRTCKDTNSDGCLEWTGVESCGSGKKCSSGQCIDDCSDECSAGQKDCSGSGAYRECGNFDGDSCLEWSSPVSCAGNKVCSAGACVCNNVCSDGQKQCASGTSVSACAADADGCWSWGVGVSCGANQVCSGGACVDTCVDECAEGTSECIGDGAFRSCLRDETTGCTRWSATSACADGDICQNGSCSAIPCEDECVGDKIECTASGGYRVCVASSTSSCRVWSEEKACKEGFACVNDLCQPKGDCTDECENGASECVKDGLRVCGQYDDDACFEWSNVTACAEDEVCQGDACVSSEPAAECVTAIDGRPSTIIDYPDPCFEMSDSLNWLTLPDYGYGGEMYYAYWRMDDATAIGTWHLNVTKSGKYKILAYVDGNIGSLSETQTYEVKASGKTTKATVAIVPDGTWVELGVYDLKAGKDQYVRLSNKARSKDDVSSKYRAVYDAIEIKPYKESSQETSEEDEELGHDASTRLVAASDCSMHGGKPGSMGAIASIFAVFGVMLGVCRRRREKEN